MCLISHYPRVAPYRLLMCPAALLMLGHTTLRSGIKPWRTPEGSGPEH